MDTESTIIEDNKDDLDYLSTDKGLGEWVATTCREWRDHYEANYADDHQKY